MKARDKYLEIIADRMELLKRKVIRHRDGAVSIWPGVVAKNKCGIRRVKAGG